MSKINNLDDPRKLVLAFSLGWLACSVPAFVVQNGEKKLLKKMVLFQKSLIDVIVAYENFVPEDVRLKVTENMQFDRITREFNG